MSFTAWQSLSSSTATNTIIGGHARVQALKHQGQIGKVAAYLADKAAGDKAKCVSFGVCLNRNVAGPLFSYRRRFRIGERLRRKRPFRSLTEHERFFQVHRIRNSRGMAFDANYASQPELKRAYWLAKRDAPRGPLDAIGRSFSKLKLNPHVLPVFRLLLLFCTFAPFAFARPNRLIINEAWPVPG